MVQCLDINDIESFEEIELNEVCDITIENNHNYFLKTNNSEILVHNSQKTWSGIFFIIYLALYRHKDKGCTINIYRETYNEFKTTLYDDFKRILDLFKLPNKFSDNAEIPSFKIGKTKVFFLGDGKHGGGCDYAFFNEAMMQKESVFNQVEMRCRVFWWMDYNPSFTQHWVFDRILKRPDVAFLRTTFKDNKHISASELNKILSYEPWLPNSYEVIDDAIYYNGKEVDDTNLPPPHPVNIEQGTADEYMWKCYGLGLKGAMQGQIFKNIKWIEKFPDVAFTYGLDFGFTNDPTALVKFAKEGRNIYLELLIYTPIESPDVLNDLLEALGVSKYVPITGDSADRYVSGRNGVVQMVRNLYDRGWEISKVSKTKSIMYWLGEFKTNKIHIVKNGLWRYFKTEQENYRYKEVSGIMINQPIDGFDHAFSAARYAFMSHDVDNFSADFS